MAEPMKSDELFAQKVFISQDEIPKYNKLKSIQSALVSKRILPKEVVSRIQKDSQQQNIPFLSSLINSGLVSAREMQTLLFDLFHIPFKYINDFIYDKKDLKVLIQVLEKQKSWKNTSIPLALKNNTILFGITDPENILFLEKLNAYFPPYRFQLQFISFLQFSKLHIQLYETAADPTQPSQNPLDLSLLLNFKASIKNPEKEKDAITTLYEKYELLRRFMGNPKRGSLENEFNEFIIQTHKKITSKYNNQIINFSLKKENRDVKIIAFPKT